ncbi:MAG: hypothetical protein ACK5ME_09000 [Parahaliea sp.]
MYKQILIVLFFCLAISGITGSNTATATTINLEDWHSWVEEKHPDLACPWQTMPNLQHHCIWPGHLRIKADKQGATFEYEVSVYRNGTMTALPGDSRYWPQQVLLAHEAAPVIDRDGLPYLLLNKGQHRVSGSIVWAKKPAQLRIPATIALLDIQSDGRPLMADRRGDHILLSGETVQTTQGQNGLSIEVYRRLDDGIPMMLTTQIQLAVSGAPREVRFGSVLPEGLTAVSINSHLPARLEPDGSMRAQLKPGEHTISVVARFNSNPQSLQFLQTSYGGWPQVEYLSFNADTTLRQLKISGARPVDTNQVRIPSLWAQLPGYRVDATTVLSLESETRGDHSPAANELNVQRQLWLDFDGQGITALDRISGNMTNAWRLDAAENVTIGRASVSGSPVLITRYQDQQGIEIRSPGIDLFAVTRQAAINEIPAVGWQAMAKNWKASLHLPPGWRLLYAEGVDSVQGAWINQWDLWDVFLLLVIVAATRKLFNIRVAALAGLTYFLAQQEHNTPLGLLPVLLIIIALLPLAHYWIRHILLVVAGLISICVVILFLGFAVESFRLAIYPSLERHSVGEYQHSTYARSNDADYISEVTLSEPVEAVAGTSRSQSKSDPLKSKTPRITAPVNLYQIDDSDRVQTGPGQPTWTWNYAQLRSSGPVDAQHQLQLYFSKPWMTIIWRILMVLSTGLYSAIILHRLLRQGWNNTPNNPENGNKVVIPTAIQTSTVAMLLAVLLPLIQPATVQANDYPPSYLLTELEQRILRTPDCLPQCIGINQARLQLSGSTLQLNADAFAGAHVALALPTLSGTMQWRQVLGNGEPLPLSRDKNGIVFAALTPGHTQLELTAQASSEQVSLTFPVALHNLSVDASGWQLEGLVDGRAINNAISLTRIDPGQKLIENSLRPDSAPPFVRVLRHISLNQQWTVETSIIRVAPGNGAISVQIPLIEGERLLTEIGTVRDGALYAHLAPNQQRLSWTSRLEPVNQLHLQASTDLPLVEEWQFTPSSRWRLDYSGLPPVKSGSTAATLSPTFKPWPGETLEVAIVLPEAVEGPTHTIEDAYLYYTAGDRLQKSTLDLRIRASIGEDFTIGLPADAEILSLQYADRMLNLPSGHQVTVALRPGDHLLRVEFQQRTAQGILQRTPSLELPGGTTNLRINYTLPEDRWPLYLNGPAIGPAMLYWGVLCVVLLGAFSLHWLGKRLEFELPISLIGWVLLGIGLSTVNAYGVIAAALFMFALAARRKYINPQQFIPTNFNLLQVALVILGVIAAISILSVIPLGLLADPQMKVVGNGSYNHSYKYYQDIAGAGDFPKVTVVSVPLMVYRAVMLLWSLWLSMRIIAWAQWGWQCYSHGGTWRSKNPVDSSAK